MPRNTEGSIPMKYNTAVKAHGSIPEGKKVCNETFRGNGLTVFQHDICHGVHPLFRKATAIHTEIAWVAGYDKFTKGSIAEGSTFDEYCAAIGNLCRSLKVPAFIVCGKQNVKKLNPDRVRPVWYAFHRIDAMYAIFNYDGRFSPIDEYEGREFICRHFDVVLDPCCGYGIIAPVIQRHRKQGILSDINVPCLEYVNETYVKGRQENK